MEREYYVWNICEAVRELNDETFPPAVSARRLVTGAFLGCMLPSYRNTTECLHIEHDAGFRTLSVYLPKKCKPALVLDALMHQTVVPLEGVIFSVHTNWHTDHTLALVFDEESKRGQGIILIDSLREPERYWKFPSVDACLTYTHRFSSVDMTSLTAVIHPWVHIGLDTTCWEVEQGIFLVLHE